MPPLGERKAIRLEQVGGFFVRDNMLKELLSSKDNSPLSEKVEFVSPQLTADAKETLKKLKITLSNKDISLKLKHYPLSGFIKYFNNVFWKDIKSNTFSGKNQLPGKKAVLKIILRYCMIELDAEFQILEKFIENNSNNLVLSGRHYFLLGNKILPYCVFESPLLETYYSSLYLLPELILAIYTNDIKEAESIINQYEKDAIKGRAFKHKLGHDKQSLYLKIWEKYDSQINKDIKISLRQAVFVILRQYPEKYQSNSEFNTFYKAFHKFCNDNKINSLSSFNNFISTYRK